jgi:hypothetical protein
MDGRTMVETRQGRTGPVEGEHLIGYDLGPDRRPGAPMHASPEPAGPVGGRPPESQRGAARRLHRATLDRPTPVFGTAQPLHGLSGVIRRAAYRVPEHRARHWLLLMAGDRVDVLEDRLGTLLGRPLIAVGAKRPARRVRASPLPFLAGLVAGLILARAARDRSPDLPGIGAGY